MKLLSIPKDFSSVLSDSHFCFGEVSADVPVEVEFWGDTPQGEEMLGCKRYLGSTTIAASPTTYLRRGFAPKPRFFNHSAFFYPEERNLALFVRWDGGSQSGGTQSSSKVLFVASQRDLEVGTVVNAGDTMRQIARGERDEVGFCVPEATQMTMEMKFPNGQTISLNQNSGTKAGLWILSVDVDWVLSRMPEGEEVDSFELVLKIAGSQVATIHYDIVERPASAVRLGWLDGSGTIAFHTFPVAMEERMQTERKQFEVVEGGAVVASIEGFWAQRLRSGALPKMDFERLSGLLTSPLVWRIYPNGSFEQVAIISAEAGAGGSKGAAEVSVVVRPQCKQRYW
jgi:hypothetical protein